MPEVISITDLHLLLDKTQLRESQNYVSHAIHLAIGLVFEMNISWIVVSHSYSVIPALGLTECLRVELTCYSKSS